MLGFLNSYDKKKDTKRQQTSYDDFYKHILGTPHVFVKLKLQISSKAPRHLVYNKIQTEFNKEWAYYSSVRNASIKLASQVTRLSQRNALLFSALEKSRKDGFCCKPSKDFTWFVCD